MPLDGLRVVELASYIAVPSAGLALSQLGAEVIRVEPLGGGPDRSRWPLAPDGSSLYWDGLNRGKHAVALDLRSDAGRRVVADLVRSGGSNGGVLISNSRLNGYAFDDLVPVRPDLIHAQLTGRRDGRPSVDYTANAASGFPLVTGPAGSSGPINHVLPAWDLLAGSQLALAVVAAVAARRHTGAGAKIELALDDVALAAAGNLGLLAEAELSETPRGRIGNSVYGDLGGDFRTRDGQHVMLVVLTESHWNRLVQALGLETQVASVEAALGCDFGDGNERYRHRGVLGDLIRHWFERHTLREASATLERSSLLWSRYLTFRELATSPEIRSHPMVSHVWQGVSTRQLATASPVRYDGRRRPARPSPLVGEHDDVVVSEILGYSSDQVMRLREQRVIGPQVDRPGPAEPVR
jgi:2-methylfumaryl-CoA isomerase